MRDVIIVGSTGSIGTQALEVVAAHPQRFRVVGLAAGGGNVELLAEQVLRHEVASVAVAKAESARELSDMLAAKCGSATGSPEILVGPDAAAELVRRPCDVVLNAITGSIGLGATLEALKAGTTLALANKESLVAGGPLVRQLAQQGQIVPVDSEHSALAQALRGGTRREVRQLVVTASGGPFRGKTAEELRHVTPRQALAHPTWNMGPHVTINSATLMNKALEVIEAHELFDVPYSAIEVVVHPQSMVHSMVEFVDGSTIAQASMPDMRLPIGLALAWPERLAEANPQEATVAPPWENEQRWEFFPLRGFAATAVSLAREVGEMGGVLPAIFNAANEECVEAFLLERLPFTQIVDTVSRVVDMSGSSWNGYQPDSVEDIVAAEQWARAEAHRVMEKA